MNLYLIVRTGPIDYDEYGGFVIAAEGEKQVREIAAGLCYREEKEIWLRTFDGNYYTPIPRIELLASDVSLPEGVVLSDYRAG